MKNVIYSVLIIFIITCTLFTFSANLLAEDKNEEKETVFIKAGHMKYVENIIEFENGVEIKRDETLMNAPSGNYNKDKKQALLENGVKVKYDKGNVESKTMTGFLNEDKYIFKQEVVLNHTLEDEKTFKLQAPYLEMLSKTNSFTAKQGVIINHDGRILKSKTADYEDENEILKLSGDVYIKEDGDWIKSDKAEFNLGSEKEEFTADGNVELELDI